MRAISQITPAITPAARFDSLTVDVSRILAATAIFYFHAGLFRHCPFSRYGESAVEYFVMLSGVTYALFSSSKPVSPAGYVNYVKKRLATLFPMYLLINGLLYLASLAQPLHLGKHYSFAEFLASATGASMYLGWPYLSAVMWFMPFIAQVYLLLPLLNWWAGRTRPVVVMVTAFCLSCLLAQMTPFLCKDATVAGLACKNWSPLFRLPEVCVGILLGRAALGKCRTEELLQAVAAYGILSLLVSLSKAAHVGLMIYLPWRGFWVPTLLLGVSVLISPLLRTANARFIRLLGVSSFTFFLIQAAPMHALSSRFGNQAPIWILYYLACWLFAVGATLLISHSRNFLRTRRRGVNP